MSPRQASGSVTRRKAAKGPQPSVRASPTRRGSTSSKAVRAERTSSGNDITAIASTTAFQVKTTTMPWLASQPPSGERRPSASSRTRPTAVGGRTSGSDSSVSMAPLPGPS